jgi:thioredoxin-dependent peroxiredoxin
MFGSLTLYIALFMLFSRVMPLWCVFLVVLVVMHHRHDHHTGVIEKMFVEQPMIPNSVADPFKVSDAQTILEYLEQKQQQQQQADPLAHKLEKSWKSPKKEGDFVPNVTFRTRSREANSTPVESEEDNFDWKDVTTQDYMENKRVVVFALPGAFTPTCSVSHLPGYMEKYDEIKALGIDEVYCLSVNDAHVMRQWGLQQGLTEDVGLVDSGDFTTVKLIADGAASFTRSMGMSIVWTSQRGFGERSWRYSMVRKQKKMVLVANSNSIVFLNSCASPSTTHAKKNVSDCFGMSSLSLSSLSNHQVVNHGQIEKLFIEPDRHQNSGVSSGGVVFYIFFA